MFAPIPDIDYAVVNTRWMYKISTYFFLKLENKKNKREVLPHCYAICLCSLDVYQTKNSSRATAPIFSTF